MHRLPDRRILLAVFCGIVTTAPLIVGALAFGDGERRGNPWEAAVAAIERHDEKHPPPHNGIVFVGSSSIRFWKLEKYFPNQDVINRGFGGSYISDSVYFAERLVLKHKPRTIVLYAGDNDLAAGKSPETVFGDLKQFDQKIHTALPAARILVISVKPCRLRAKLIDKVRQTNELIEAHCKKDERLVYVDVFHPMLEKDGKPRKELFIFDGLHLNTAGYKLWASLVSPHLNAPSDP